MHGAPVIPQCHVAGLPLVQVVKLRLARMPYQLLQQIDRFIIAEPGVMRRHNALQELLADFQYLATCNGVRYYCGISNFGETRIV